MDDEADSAKKPEKMAIGGDGGFQVDKPKHTIEKEFALVAMPDRTTIPLPCPELPTIVLEAITAIQVGLCRSPCNTNNPSCTQPAAVMLGALKNVVNACKMLWVHAFALCAAAGAPQLLCRPTVHAWRFPQPCRPAPPSVGSYWHDHAYACTTPPAPGAPCAVL